MNDIKDKDIKDIIDIKYEEHKKNVKSIIYYNIFLCILLFIVACILAILNINENLENKKYIYENIFIFSVLFFLNLCFYLVKFNFIRYVLLSFIYIIPICFYVIKYENTTKILEKEDAKTKFSLFISLYISVNIIYL